MEILWILGAHTFTYCLSGTSLPVNITETLWQGTLYRSKRDLFPDVQIVLMVVSIPILSVLYICKYRRMPGLAVP